MLPAARVASDLFPAQNLFASTVLSVGIALAVVVGLVLLVAWRPGILYRPFLWLITHNFYRMRVYGRDNLPAQGPALIVCNHVSYIDWLLLLAAQRRFIRFVIF